MVRKWEWEIIQQLPDPYGQDNPQNRLDIDLTRECSGWPQETHGLGAQRIGEGLHCQGQAVLGGSCCYYGSATCK